MKGVHAGAVYQALTCDYGLGHRDPDEQADNVLDLNGLLHVKDVGAFIEALTAWQLEVELRVPKTHPVKQTVTRRCGCGRKFEAPIDRFDCDACHGSVAVSA